MDARGKVIGSMKATSIVTRRTWHATVGPVPPQTSGRMKPRQGLGLAAQVAIAAIVLPGMVDGSLTVAHSDFATSTRRGGPSVVEPVPAAHILVTLLCGMSMIGLVALVRARNPTAQASALAVTLYVLMAAALTVAITPI